MDNEQKILVIIPTYNEAANIALLIKGIFSLDIPLSVLVVDDNSPDGTSEKVKATQELYSNLFLITRAQKSGLAGAYKEGFRYALRQGYLTIVQMDADLSHAPESMPAMLNGLDGCDMVIGSRYVKGGKILNWPFKRKLLSRAGNMFSMFMLGVTTKDLTGGFKCFKSSVLDKINFNAISSKGYAFQIEFTLRAIRTGIKVIEHPIVFKGRLHEHSKISEHIVKEAFLRVLLLGLYKTKL